jgi:glutamyl/glutaminyl-tRNA synthetase
VPDEPTIASLRGGGPSAVRQSDRHARYAAIADELATRGLVYPCDCTRSTFADWADRSGRAWSGPGCPGGCARRGLDRSSGAVLRVSLGSGDEPWDDLVLGPQLGAIALAGDLPIRDRNGNWTYGFCVVVDDLDHGIDLVVRGEDLLDATPAQVCLGRLLGRAAPPLFLHHPLVRRPDGRKLSKADGATAVREILAGGVTAVEVRARAAAAIGLGGAD